MAPVVAKGERRDIGGASGSLYLGATPDLGFKGPISAGTPNVSTLPHRTPNRSAVPVLLGRDLEVLNTWVGGNRGNIPSIRGG
jgi:hypothetical protein